MISGFLHKTNKGYTLLEYGVEQQGVLYYALVKRLDTGEYSRMSRRQLEAITLPKEAEDAKPAPITQPKKHGIQLGFL